MRWRRCGPGPECAGVPAERRRLQNPIRPRVERIQPAGRVINEFYEAARSVLKHPLLTFDAADVEAIARAFADVIRDRRYTCYACAIMPDHPVWGGPGWKVFLETRDDMARTDRYICGNPTKTGLPAQLWPFVKQYDGWLPGQVTFVRPATPQANRNATR